MPTIYHDLTISAPISKVFEGVTNPALIDVWWTRKCQGIPKIGEEYTLDFSPECIWKAVVSECKTDECFELTMTDAMEDWLGSRLRFSVDARENGTKLRFEHKGWAEVSEHFRISSYCWAVYLNVLKKHLETGVVIPYEERHSA
ncbi:MAG: SRPBCC domain-containing protein [Pyrinomonadaceae bacterium]